MKNKKIVLCVTHSDDSYPVDWVIEHLNSQGAISLRINSDAYPLGFKMSGCLDQENTEVHIETSIGNIEASRVSAIWHRKNRHCDLKDHVDEALLEQSIRESETIKVGLLHSLDAFWLDHPDIQFHAENKWRQLMTAKRAGLSVPPSLFSNDPEKVTQFYFAQNRQVVAKMHTPFSVSMGRPEAFVYTSKITEAHLSQLDGLKYSPMIFQVEVHKETEIRVAYVDGDCFAASIDVSEQSKAQLDWRKADPIRQWEQVSLPCDVKENISRFMGSMNLKFGAIDFILDTEGNYQFLEVNPAGEWGMLEKDTGMPISESIAKCLLRHSA
ncbi:RimK-like ATP-grasp domain protein [Grimontia celer]|uniref:RimK-like ATP-grasp domain protein n=1 Tax=Grimontia celer TaxID=1796497 RepID=A0A128EWT1_9GAMM|nr:hypothetical protein [Grimontia celer]CZF79017.1 RimK-like ATP-grasp domain protein [Grimontia celer]